MRPLDDFVSVNREELIALIGEEVSQEWYAKALKEHWFEPTDGLTTTRYLISNMRENRHTSGRAMSLLKDLRGLEKNLLLADSKKLRFRLAWDF